MPNLVVYVPAKLWQRLEEELGTEWPAWAREATVKHIREMLSERDRGRPVSPVAEEVPQERATSVAASAVAPRSESTDRDVKPDFK